MRNCTNSLKYIVNTPMTNESLRERLNISKKNYPLYIKEMEFRFNHRNENVYNLLIDTCIVRGQFSPDLH